MKDNKTTNLTSVKKDSFMKKIIAFICLFFSMFLLFLCLIVFIGGVLMPKVPNNYTIHSIDDVSYEGAVRKTMDIVVGEEYSLDDLEKIAKKEIKNYIAKNDVNSITVGFYIDPKAVGKGYQFGSMSYYPNGKLEDASKVETGDYETFEYVNDLHNLIGSDINDDLTENNYENISLPSYTIEHIDDANLGKVIRETIHIVVDGKYTREDLEKIAKKEIINYTEKHKVNALTIGFYENKSNINR